MGWKPLPQKAGIRMLAKLALEDGTVYTGTGAGAAGECVGEVVFNTSITGYQEIVTDPSYKGQIVTMTYPLIGNYGTNPEDAEAANPQVEGFIVREFSRIESNFRSRTGIREYLAAAGIVCLEGVDTRAITRRIRSAGAMNGVISTTDLDDESLVAKAKTAPKMMGLDLVRAVTPTEATEWRTGMESQFAYTPGTLGEAARKAGPGRRRVVAVDYGAKRNILRLLYESGCDVTVVPATWSAEQILARRPDGVFLSNGPGDPGAVEYAVEAIRKLVGRTPIFGICLGHQLLGLALGGKRFKLKFGHRGANHPVKDLVTGKIAITSQNHGFALDADSLADKCVDITHINLNDNTVEGFAHRELPIFSVQYHPEASPGPHESTHLFERFARLMSEHSGK